MSYSTVAVKAAKLAADEKLNPVDAWKHCAKIEYPDSASSQKKGCPKNAFLGLCGEGIVKGIPKGIYTSSRLNKLYALTAVDILVNNQGRIYTPDNLWKTVLAKTGADKNKLHNSQMQVVLALWDAHLIIAG